MLGRLARFKRDENGSIAILFAMVAVVLFGMTGLAIDFGRAVVTRTRLQAAVDAATLAATKAPPDDAITEAEKFFEANLGAASEIAGLAISASFAFNEDGHLVGSASADVATTIMQIFNAEKLTVVASATVVPSTTSTSTKTETVTKTITTPGSIPCIHVMDQNEKQALKLISNSSVDARNCEIYVRSNDKDAILTDSESNVKWKKILVKGAGGTMRSGRDTIMDAPNAIQFNQPVVGNPYSEYVNEIIRQITVGACTSANTDKSYKNVTVSPGTYCGATTFDGATFQKGLYIIASGNGNKDGKLTLKGKHKGAAGVSFYFADNKARLVGYSGEEGSVLSAPTDGLTQGLLFFENSNRGNTWSLCISSLSKNIWNGVVYFPSGNLQMHSWSMDSGQKISLGLTANQLEINSWSGITNTYAWTPYGYSRPITYPGTTTTTTEVVTTEVTEVVPGRIKE